MKFSPNKIKIFVLGTGTFAMDVADLISDIPDIDVVGFVASIPPYESNTTLLDKPIYWIDELTEFDHSYQTICALVTTKRYKFIKQVEKMGFTFARIIHPTARVSRTASIGEGSIVNAGVQIATHSKVGRHVVLNRGALIGHHNIIQDFATVSPGANVAGSVTIGERAWIGLGANILEKRTIGEGSIIGAGSLVSKDVPPRVKVIGYPAMVVERNVDGL